MHDLPDLLARWAAAAPDECRPTERGFYPGPVYRLFYPSDEDVFATVCGVDIARDEAAMIVAAVQAGCLARGYTLTHTLLPSGVSSVAIDRWNPPGPPSRVVQRRETAGYAKADSADLAHLAAYVAAIETP